MIAYKIAIRLMEYSINIVGYFSVTSVLTETFLSHQTTKFNKQIWKTVEEIIEKRPLAIAALRILILQEII